MGQYRSRESRGGERLLVALLASCSAGASPGGVELVVGQERKRLWEDALEKIPEPPAAKKIWGGKVNDNEPDKV